MKYAILSIAAILALNSFVPAQDLLSRIERLEQQNAKVAKDIAEIKDALTDLKASVDSLHAYGKASAPKVAAKVKAPCSLACTCGCNADGTCTCGAPRSAIRSAEYAVVPTTYSQPVYQAPAYYAPPAYSMPSYAPSYAPAYSAPAYSFPQGGFGGMGFRGGFGGGGCGPGGCR